MIKLYDLVFEDIEKNDIDLGDKTQEFNEKLELMSPKLQNVLIGLVTKLNDTEKKELGSLINKYPDIKGLESPKTPLEKKNSPTSSTKSYRTWRDTLSFRITGFIYGRRYQP